MTQQPVTNQPGWYTRPVLFVANLDRAIGFYVGMLGFRKKWHEGDGAGTVCQVNRGDCEIILCEHATRRDKARLFIELNVDELAELRRELAARFVPSREMWWGYDSIQIDDPDGNELILPIEGNSEGRPPGRPPEVAAGPAAGPGAGFRRPVRPPARPGGRAR
jgi:catechol 2,3-dioxygenase-like lactoylglutathione lyase family enzyme